MPNAIFKALLYSLAPLVGMAAGGAAAAWGEPGRRIRSYIQHFAAGVVFAAVGVEVLPEVMHRSRPLTTAGGFAVGVVAMLAIRAMSRRAESCVPEGGRTPWPLLSAVGVDIFVDGALIGFGFAVGQRQGILLAIALSGCAVSLGLATAAAILHSGGSRRQAAGLTSCLALLPVLGAGSGALLAAGLSGAWMAAALSFTCAALLYLIAEELLLEAHESPHEQESAFTSATFFVGFLAILILDMLM